MEEGLDKNLCMKFASDLVETVIRVKGSRETSNDQMFYGADYYIHSGGLRKLYEKADSPIMFFIALSVGQYYHEGNHAASQIACLDNIRKSYEAWMQDGFIGYDERSCEEVQKKWPITFVATDSHQALNAYQPVKIDLNKGDGQCIELLKNPALNELEGSYVEKGQASVKSYKQLLTACNKNNKNKFSLHFDLNKETIRWCDLKKEYDEDYLAVMVNFLERCFKFGVQHKSSKSKIPEDWQKKVMLNDISYVIAEIVMLYAVIFKPKSVEEKGMHNFLLYPGPLNVIIGSGKNILGARFKNQVSISNFTFLRAENLKQCCEKEKHKRERQSEFFSGKLDGNDEGVLADKLTLKNREIFVAECCKGKVSREKVVLFSMTRCLTRGKKEERRRQKRKREQFEKTEYAVFLENFSGEISRWDKKIKQYEVIVNTKINSKNPITNLKTLCELCVPSLNDSVEGCLISSANTLVSDLKKLEKKYLKEQKPKYLLLAGSKLVQCVLDPVFSKHEFQMSVLMYSLDYLISAHVTTEDLSDPDYYPDEIPQIEYMSSQSQPPSQSSSPLSQSGNSFPFSQP